MIIDSLPRAASELSGVEAGVQRACGVGLGVFVLQAAVVVAVGQSLYPLWWHVVVWPGMLAVTVGMALSCVQGRSRPVPRVVGALALTVVCVVTAVATADTVTSVLSACAPLTTAMICVLGLLDVPRIAVPTGVLLAACQIGSVAATRPIDAHELVVLAAIQMAILIAATAAGRMLRRAASRQEAEHRGLLAALSADRAALESRADRREQERQLHDTVLNTLTALARASLGDSPRLRARCARDAQYLRSLLAMGGHPHEQARPELASEIRALALEISTPTCHVSIETDTELPAVPAPVAQALTRAARQALTNGFNHSGSHLLKVKLAGDGAGVTVVLSDEGCGITTGPAEDDRFGIRRSIVERMADVGGAAELGPGRLGGTRVVLRWPA